MIKKRNLPKATKYMTFQNGLINIFYFTSVEYQLIETVLYKYNLSSHCTLLTILFYTYLCRWYVKLS